MVPFPLEFTRPPGKFCRTRSLLSTEHGNGLGGVPNRVRPNKIEYRASENCLVQITAGDTLDIIFFLTKREKFYSSYQRQQFKVWPFWCRSQVESTGDPGFHVSSDRPPPTRSPRPQQTANRPTHNKDSEMPSEDWKHYKVVVYVRVLCFRLLSDVSSKISRDPYSMSVPSGQLYDKVR